IGVLHGRWRWRNETCFSSVAAYMRTGMFTSPKLIDPFHMVCNPITSILRMGAQKVIHRGKNRGTSPFDQFPPAVAGLFGTPFQHVTYPFVKKGFFPTGVQFACFSEMSRRPRRIPLLQQHPVGKNPFFTKGY